MQRFTLKTFITLAIYGTDNPTPAQRDYTINRFVIGLLMIISLAIIALAFIATAKGEITGETMVAITLGAGVKCLYLSVRLRRLQRLARQG